MKRHYRKYSLLLIAIAGIFPCTAQLKDAIKLKVSGNSYSDETVIRFLQGSTQGFDGNYDAWKLFSSNQNVPAIFSKEKKGKALSINAAGVLTADTVLPVFLIVPAAGSYIINTYELGKFADNVQITITNLATGSFYTINKDTAFAISFSSADRDTASAKLSIRFKTQEPQGPAELVQINPVNATCFGQSNGKIQYSNNTTQPMGYKLVKGGVTSTGSINPGADSISGLVAGNYSLIITYLAQSDTFPVSLKEPLQVIADFDVTNDSVFLFSGGGQVSTTNTSMNAINYEWNFGDGSAVYTQVSPSHSYSAPGTYSVTLLAKANGCMASLQKKVYIMMDVTTSIQEKKKLNYVIENGEIKIDLKNGYEKPLYVLLADISGRIVLNTGIEINRSESVLTLPLSVLSKGMYVLSLVYENKRSLSSTFVVRD